MIHWNVAFWSNVHICYYFNQQKCFNSFSDVMMITLNRRWWLNTWCSSFRFEWQLIWCWSRIHLIVLCQLLILRVRARRSSRMCVCLLNSLRWEDNTFFKIHPRHLMFRYTVEQQGPTPCWLLRVFALLMITLLML